MERVDESTTCAIQLPQYSKWRMEICGGNVLMVLEGQERNWFHRKMQEWILGIKWRKE